MQRVKFIAEIGGNHFGSLDMAKKLISSAAYAGADYVKFQAWKKDTMAVKHTIEDGPWKGRELTDLYKEIHTPWEWLPTLFSYAREKGIIPFTSIFDAESLDAVQFLKPSIYKISSFELVDIPLIEAIAKKGMTIMLSTGMASTQEIQEAIEACGNCQVVLMKCTSGYPTPPNEVNLESMQSMYFRHKKIVGLSDHTRGIGISIAAAAMGAAMIEKHLILDRKQGGPDCGFSLEPYEFKLMVMEARRAQDAMGKMTEGPTESEGSSIKLRRSLYWAKPMKAGEIITRECLKTARPALGVKPKHHKDLLGKIVLADTNIDEPVKLTQVSWQFNGFEVV